jgi:hypothetical protein
MSNPQAMQALAANAKLPKLGGDRASIGQHLAHPEVQYRQPEDKILKQFGIDLPHDWVLHTEDDGAVSVRHLNWWQRNNDWAIPLMFAGGVAAAVAIPAIIGAGAGGGGAAAAGGGAAATGGGTGAAVGGGTLASTTIGSGFVPSLVEGGTGLASLGGGAAASATGGALADAALTGGAAAAPEAAAPAAAAATVPEAGAITPTTLAGMPGAGTGGLASSPLATPAVATTLPTAPTSSLGGSAASLASSPSALTKYAGIASKLSPVLSEAAKGRASGLAQENVANYRLDTTALDRTKQNNQALLDEMKARIDSQNQYSKSQNQDTTSTQRGDLLANVQDVVATHPRANIVHYEGGIRPSALGPNARAAGQMLSNNALANMRQPALTPPTLAMADPLTQKPNGGKTSLTDRLLSYGSLASGLSGLWRG